MKNSNKSSGVPTYMDDMTIKIIRNGKSKADKEFMINDPRFNPETMKRRAERRSITSRSKWKKDMIERFSK